MANDKAKKPKPTKPQDLTTGLLANGGIAGTLTNNDGEVYSQETQLPVATATVKKSKVP